VDLALGNSNKVIECTGPAHYTIFNKKLKGQTQLRIDILKKMGKDPLVLSADDWINWKAQNTNRSKLLEFVNK